MLALMANLKSRRAVQVRDPLPDAYVNFPESHVPSRVLGKIQVAGKLIPDTAWVELWVYTGTYGQGPMNRIARVQSRANGEYLLAYQGRKGQQFVGTLMCHYHQGIVLRHQSLVVGQDTKWDFNFRTDPMTVVNLSRIEALS